MPNWVFSVLEITGPKDEVASIAEIDFDFEKFLPIPADLDCGWPGKPDLTDSQKQANLAIYGHESWYTWCIENWGTKWSPSEVTQTMSDDGKTLDATMNTPWGLPMQALSKLSQNHPNTIIRITDCEEEAGFFVGSCAWLNGELIEDTIHEPTKRELIKRGMLDEDYEEDDWNEDEEETDATDSSEITLEFAKTEEDKNDKN